MSCEHMGRAVICCLSKGPYRIVAKGQEYRFDFGEYVGPSLIGKRGNYVSTMPSQFLIAVSWWYRQGKKVGGDGLCAWEVPKQGPFYHIGGRHYVTEDIYKKLRAEGKFVKADIEPEWFDERL